ncbi:MAG: DUF6473 family protein [Pseudomonadota bacterium]
MSYEGQNAREIHYAPCRYGQSQLVFRGPESRLDEPFVAFLGGNETYGKFIEAPFPVLVERHLGLKCVNFGVQNAGIDVFLNDEPLLKIAAQAEATVLQVVGAHNMTNRYYAVHPRRNDRFLSASAMLQSIYPEADFAEFHFTKHMLRALYGVSDRRFASIRRELQHAWVARMKLLIGKIPGTVVLVWFAEHRPQREEGPGSDPVGVAEPVFVTVEMLEELRPLVRNIVEIVPSQEALAARTDGMVFGDMEAPAAQRLFGPAAHGEVASAMSAVLQDLL